MTNNFLPADYVAPQGGGNRYLKLEIGETRFRIISNPLLGWVSWTDTPDGRKPNRTPAQHKDAKHFWALVVLHGEEVQIAEFTQKSILSAIQDLARSTDWGHPSGYDIIITRKGSGLDSEYTVRPCPKGPIPAALMEKAVAAGVGLDELFSGGDPFDASPVVPKTKLTFGAPF